MCMHLKICYDHERRWAETKNVQHIHYAYQPNEHASYQSHITVEHNFCESLYRVHTRVSSRTQVLGGKFLPDTLINPPPLSPNREVPLAF